MIRTPHKILVLGDAAVPTGFANVIYEIIAPMSSDFEIHQLGVNYIGGEHNWPWKIYPAMERGIGMGFARLPILLENLKPSLIFMLADDVILARWMKIIQDWEGRSRAKVIVYCPVDNSPVQGHVASKLASADRLFTFTDFGIGCLNDAYTKHHVGKTDLTPLLVEKMPHGVDTNIFCPIGKDINYHLSDEGRLQAKRRLVGEDSELDGSFIVFNGNRNQERKHQDITIRGFAKFAANKPDHVKLYMHCGVKDQGWNIIELMEREGAINRLIMSTTLGVKPAFSSEELNKIYGACEVGINTSSAEGWGLVSFEHAATGAAQLAPGHTGTHELWKGHADLLYPSATTTEMNTLKDFHLISDDKVADALELLYKDKTHWHAQCLAAYKNATRADYNWSTISARWRKCFDEELDKLNFSLANKESQYPLPEMKIHSAVLPKMKVARYFKQYGAQRSGTNYLRALLETNFKNVKVLMHTLGGKHAVPVNLDKYKYLTEVDPVSFVKAATSEIPAENTLPLTSDKLSFLEEHADDLSESVVNKQLFYIISIKNPYSWINSIFRKNPLLEDHADQDKIKLFREIIKMQCNEYNVLYSSYLELANEKPSQTMVIRYDDLISDPQKILNELADLLKLEPKNASFTDVNATVFATDWDHQLSINSTGDLLFEKKNYEEKRYLATLLPVMKEVMEQEIDWKLAALYGYSKEE